MSETYQTMNPATGELVATFPQSSDLEVLTSLEIAHECFNTTWRRYTITNRAKVVARAAAILMENLEEHAQLITLEMGKLIEQSRREVQVSADILKYYADHAESFLRPSEKPSQRAIIHSEPIGVVLAIEPWNFPYSQLARVAGPQIMAGNVLLVKPAPSTPQCALAFARVIQEAECPKGVYTNLFCSIDQVNTLIDDFRVRGVTLTGSERAGSAVAERAGRNLKKTVLELGGSDAAVILEDANMDNAVQCSLKARLITMDRTDAFISGLTSRLSKFVPGKPTDVATTIGPLGSQRSLDIILEQVSISRSHGARVIMGGKRIDCKGFYMEPTIITNISSTNPLFAQETFGPVFSIYTAANETEAVSIANATKFGLGASVYSENKENAHRIGGLLDCGMVFINGPPFLSAEMPWGGVKNSGYGRELGGELGIMEFVNQKMIRLV
ncbi:Aldehyde/histidinol dehydrogenase [Trichoderma velutinum]